MARRISVSLISYSALCIAVAENGELASEKAVVGFPEDWGRICITTAGAASCWRGRCQAEVAKYSPYNWLTKVAESPVTTRSAINKWARRNGISFQHVIYRGQRRRSQQKAPECRGWTVDAQGQFMPQAVREVKHQNKHMAGGYSGASRAVNSSLRV
ncbi:hypothetical protein GX51_03769 [Blastomyces parvus]|uniref:Uncharacterized protein n=1 Tax=Blastomyces parvus TaxID=2060905 RepID=A0A2B7X572_9EURO|nr:hypothetical protein GX51_03769 [Blastomyces parvus]